MPSSSQRPFVLLVEDSEDDFFFFQRALRLAGFAGQLAHVADGAAAVAYLEKATLGSDGTPVPDLVFLDLKIPALSGFEVLQWIRRREEAPLDVAVLSGSEHASDVERAMSLGATAYYVKPILVQQLKTRLAAWWETSSLAVATGETAVSSGGEARV